MKRGTKGTINAVRLIRDSYRIGSKAVFKFTRKLFGRKKMSDKNPLGFKFEIGDLVATGVGLADSRLDSNRTPKCMYVTERKSVECCGGLQLFYSVVSAGQAFNEPEGNLFLWGDIRDEFDGAKRRESWRNKIRASDNDTSTT